MFWLGLLLPVCFIPGITGASIPTQWAVLSLILPFSLPHAGWITLWHRLGIVFLTYAILSVAWSVNYYSAVYGLWLAAIWALAFWYGSTKVYLEPLWKGLALGLTASTGVAIAQALEFVPVVTNDTYSYAGLLFNSSLQGVCIALVLIALITYRLYWYIPSLAIGLILSGSRGGFLILTIAAIARYVHWLAALAALILGALAYTYFGDLADSQRLQIWGITTRILSPFGYGSGSYVDIFYIAKSKDLLFHPEFVHNDYLQLWFEYGIGSIFIWAILAAALTRTEDPNWPVLVGFATLTLFFFPFYAPIPAFIGCVVAGHILRRYDPVRDYSNRRGPNLLSRSPDLQPRTDPAWREAIPLEPRA